MADYRDELAAAQARNEALAAQNEAMRAENERLRHPGAPPIVLQVGPPRAPAAVGMNLTMPKAMVVKVLVAMGVTGLLVVGGIVGIGVLFYHLIHKSPEELVAGVLRRDEKLREQACQGRRTSDTGDVALENVRETKVPGRDWATCATATLVLHPPGAPVCRAPVRFDYQTVNVNHGDRRSGSTFTAIVEIQVGENPPVNPPEGDP